ncbi:hypothetical protein [Pseudoalteromonas umbrosa]|uniref:hypothetical protein n=1 Tax=Pseudoalteromonas umbrosa TaxID=3048489 RepID=UPI0024C45C7D|nr:hypothetical protein [Pseudoalteromonas sp. B95]MDK1287743.1 hypothetical protein [Pseudoalteromonas sp. B95]
MPIVRKNHLQSYVEQLDERFRVLKLQVMGVTPNPNVYHQYHNDPFQYEEEFTEVNELKVKLAISDFEGILRELKQIKKLQAPKSKGSM